MYGNEIGYDIILEGILARKHYGEAELGQWWNNKDYLGTPTEKLFDETLNEDDILESILSDLGSRPIR